MNLNRNLMQWGGGRGRGGGGGCNISCSGRTKSLFPLKRVDFSPVTHDLIAASVVFHHSFLLDRIATDPRTQLKIDIKWYLRNIPHSASLS